MLSEIYDGTWARRREAQVKADAKAQAEEEKVRQEYQSYMRSIGHKGFVVGGNNTGLPSVNTMSDKDKKEIGIMIGKELAGGAAKITSIPVGNKFAPLGAIIDFTGDQILDSAKKDKKKIGVK